MSAVKNLITVPGFGRFQILKDGADLIYANVDPQWFSVRRFVGLAFTWDDAVEGEDVYKWGKRHPEFTTTRGAEVSLDEWTRLLNAVAPVTSKKKPVKRKGA